MVEPFPFPESKLTPPAPRRLVVDRPRLVQALRDGAARRLVVVTAEAGYGKTYLLVAALAAAGRPVAWLTLDESDTDPNLFAAGIVLSLRRIAPGVGQGALDVLTTGPSDDILAAAVRRTFEELPAETVLVLDDFHVLDATPAAHALVDRWLADAPARLRLVIASRTRPPLRALPRLLVEGEGLVLDRAALAFRPDEARALLAGSFGLLVSEEQARELAERTEGWAAALSLVARAAQSRGLPALLGTPREIFDYLATAVIDALPDELQAFAMHTSVLFVLTPDICAALTGVDARACLDALEARSLFLTRLDEDGPRYRYHQLFGEFLQQRLAGRQPALVAELHRRAGAHLEREGRGDEAVRHFLLAGAYPDAVRVLAPYRGGRLTARRAYVFRDLVRRLPRAVADAHPWLLRTAASSCRFIGDYEQALTWSRQAMAAAEGRDVDLWADAVHGVGVMRRSLGRLGEALTTLEAAVEQLPAGVSPGLVALLHQVLAFAYCVRGDLDRSARATDEALRLAVSPDDVDARSSALLNRGQLALIRLEPSVARAVFQSVREYAEEHRSGYYQVQAWAGLAAADIALGEVAGAAEALGRAQTLQAQVGERALELQLAWTEGDLALRQGELDAAEQHYERALAHWRDGELARPRVLALLGLARVDLARPRVSRALDRAREAAAIATRGEIGSLLPLAPTGRWRGSTRPPRLSARGGRGPARLAARS